MQSCPCKYHFWTHEIIVQKYLETSQGRHSLIVYHKQSTNNFLTKMKIKTNILSLKEAVWIQIKFKWPTWNCKMISKAIVSHLIQYIIDRYTIKLHVSNLDENGISYLIFNFYSSPSPSSSFSFDSLPMNHKLEIYWLERWLICFQGLLIDLHQTLQDSTLWTVLGSH